MRASLRLPFSVASLVVLSGCGSEYTIIDRSELMVSQSSRVSARNLVAHADASPALTEHLALATEVYQKQLNLLKERRNKVRTRRRTYESLALGTLTATAAGVALAALASPQDRAADNLKIAGGVAIGGLLTGSTFQVLSATQEEPETVDDKIQHLDSLYDAMLARVRAIDRQSVAPDGNVGRVDLSEAGAVIETFIAQALRINVKG